MERWLPFITTIGSVVAFTFTAWRYLDTRRRSIQQQRFEHFHRIFEHVAGRTVDGHRFVDTQQAIAVYQLSEFPEYSYMIRPIIEYYLNETRSEADNSLLRDALLMTQERLAEAG